MSERFSQKLKNRITDYFLINFDQKITDEQADEFLDSLADLFDWANNL